ncbi:MBL fold metallo-hydrolase [Reyranella sp.]|jgi:glyoxylase-like metal-dependent hydrolase (beta-lactamase superfamily II)|uniref:MBL fold metallo-hydrolase n=1 Tax=Reyranella sp. TaxID=1929291 RepID=UPI000BCD12A9|nr:MBL fold metallo-hydrolase [Reyranella sp.]OYY37664.1 MAG: MBL fold metallo-hydrolase [Rhodospirillales bacterium 35-66-84]OYZ92708.1 MAG: MBL fold metallo-hydrolase [Rhodospirillales bacterium 24-66-33]OZB24071.1 MAG: MBL fold metallo-hydrolase [Rhodospirillales bacterium 39-66-50]HQS17427.1 MBL fold metallo-hydrolase [Reyranella sp.]HQT13846.1 MBL fold metallo-hydrolase [Reyranella sp.]
MAHAPTIDAFFDEATYTVTYLVTDPETHRAAIIDPVLDYDHKSGKASTRSAERVLAKAAERQASVDWILETHAHADHLTAAPLLKARTGAKVVIGEHIRDVQRIFKKVFNAADVSEDGREFDRLVKDGEVLTLGNLRIEVLHLPGHTPADVAYRIGDAVFVGDTIFMPDYGTARTDFPGGDSPTLYRSIRRLLSLPPETRLFMCHDYKAPGRDRYAWETTVADERARNVHVHDGVAEADFVAMRTKRDATLAAPVLLLPSVQVNIRAGRLPPPDDNGQSYLKIPVKLVAA